MQKLATPPEVEQDEEQLSALATAISLWRAGKPIPLDLFTTLVEEGYEVPLLERFYRK